MDNFKLSDIPSQEGKVAVITGSNVGLGFEAAKAFASKDIEVIMACRNLKKAKNAQDKILADYPSAKLKVMKLDLNGLDSVRSFAHEVIESYDKIDILVNNAGLMMPMFFKTQEGFESQFGVNYVGHFLLSSLLFPLIEKSSDGRIISLASIAHTWGDIDFEKFMSDKTTYSKRKSYGQSKLACLMFGYELDRQLNDKGINVKSIPVHPGGSLTNLDRHLPKFVSGIIGLLGFASRPEQGAESIIYASLAEDAESGSYYGPTGFRELKGPVGKVDSDRNSKDVAKANKLWKATEGLVGQRFFA